MRENYSVRWGNDLERAVSGLASSSVLRKLALSPVVLGVVVDHHLDFVRRARVWLAQGELP